MIKLGVNIDHVATVRQARGGAEPDPLRAALLAEKAGADGITAHLREDRRHIQDSDIKKIKEGITTKLNFEMSIAEEIVRIACAIEPFDACLVPEKRQELTTEGGLDIVRYEHAVAHVVGQLKEKGIRVSLFIDPDEKQINAAERVHADAIELHTGRYADAQTEHARDKELRLLRNAAEHAYSKKLIVNAGHGLTYENIKPILSLPYLHELNIGHSIIARSIYVGISQAVQEMKAVIGGA